jgi:hypothetical protein
MNNFYSHEPLPTLPLKDKGRARTLEKSRIIPFPLLFKGKGRDRVKLTKQITRNNHIQL